MQLIIVLGIIAKLASVSGDCDVGKTVNDFANMLTCFLYQAVTSSALCYLVQFVGCSKTVSRSGHSQ
jgi:hypothetical protein